MDVRAAVAHKAGDPLSIETIQLDGPKPARFSSKSRLRVSATPTPTPYPVPIRRDCFHPFSDMKALASSLKSGMASTASNLAIT